MVCKRPAAAGAKRGGQEPQSSASSFSLPPLGLSSISDVLFGGNLVLEGFSKFCVLFFLWSLGSFEDLGRCAEVPGGSTKVRSQ